MPKFIALLNGKHIYVLTVADKIAKVQAYFTSKQKKKIAAILHVYHGFAL